MQTGLSFAAVKVCMHACNIDVGSLKHCYCPVQVLEQPRRMSKMHSWPPLEQGIERPMSDLDPVFSVPVLPKILCTVPEEEPVAMAAPPGKGNPCAAAEACAALDSRRQAEELRRVLRSMYKNHFQMQTEVRYRLTGMLMSSHTNFCQG